MQEITKRQSLVELDQHITLLLVKLDKFLTDLTFNELDKLGMVQLAALQNNLKDNIETVKIVETTLGKYHDSIRKHKLPDLMIEQDIKGMVVDGVGRVSLVDDMYASIKSNKQSEAHQWLDDHGHGDLIRESVHPSSLKALMKSKMKEGDDIPDDIFNVTPYTYCKITAEKKQQTK